MFYVLPYLTPEFDHLQYSRQCCTMLITATLLCLPDRHQKISSSHASLQQ